MTNLRVGVDTGGTFTDFVVIRGGKIEIFKEHSTPKNPAQAILQGIAKIRREGAPSEVIHGSTVATNALLERKGARTGVAGGQNGEPGKNLIYRKGGTVDESPSKFTTTVEVGDTVSLQTPGGGGWGVPLVIDHA